MPSFKTVAAVLVAASATAAARATSPAQPSMHPVERQANPSLRVTLSNAASALTEEYDAATDSSAVAVTSSTQTWDSVSVACIEICIPEYHCTLYDSALNPLMDVNPGTTALSNVQVAQVTCAQGLSTTATSSTARMRRRLSSNNMIDRKVRLSSKAKAPAPATHRRQYASLAPPKDSQAAPAPAPPRRQDAGLAPTYDGQAVFTDATTGEETTVGFYVDQSTSIGSGQTFSAATVNEATLKSTVHTFTCQAFDSAGTNLGTFFGTERYSYSFATSQVASFTCATGN